MNYLLFIWADGLPAPEELAVIQRELPGYVEEMDRRGIRLLGRELDLPETARTVRVRSGETLVSDGPFLETKEFVAGVEVLECADLDEALEIAASCPIAWFQSIEVRPFSGGPLGEQALAFGRGEDGGGGGPYLLSLWVSGTPAERFDEPAVQEECRAWREDVEARGLHLLDSSLGGADAATVVRVRNGETVLSDGPLTGTDAFISGIEVVSCADRQQAAALGATHPIARYHAIEVRPFYRE